MCSHHDIWPLAPKASTTDFCWFQPSFFSLFSPLHFVADMWQNLCHQYLWHFVSFFLLFFSRFSPWNFVEVSSAFFLEKKTKGRKTGGKSSGKTFCHTHFFERNSGFSVWHTFCHNFCHMFFFFVSSQKIARKSCPNGFLTKFTGDSKERFCGKMMWQNGLPQDLPTIFERARMHDRRSSNRLY